MNDGLVVRLTVSPQFTSDVVTTAVEGGIYYWAEVTHYRWLDVPHAYATVTERDEPKRTAVLNRETIMAGIVRVLDPAFSVREDLRGILARALALDDAGDVDVEIADVIVQAAVLGEIVYG